MVKFWGNFEEIEDLFENLTESVEKCLFNTLDLIEEYIENGENEKVKELSDLVHKTESAADEYRREIINKLLQGFLMPNTREDLMRLIETIDDIADNAERVMDSTLFIALDISDLNQELVKEMIVKIKDQYRTLKKAVSYLFSDMTQAVAHSAQLENMESLIDDIEEKIIRKISNRDDLELAQKLVYRDTIMAISDLGDTIENSGDIIEVIVALRRG